jgi:hypothetical protein
MILMKSIRSLAPAVSSSAVVGARGQFRQMSATQGGTATVASIPVDHSQIKREIGAYNSLKANGVLSPASAVQPKWSQIIPMKETEEIKGMLRAFNKARS